MTLPLLVGLLTALALVAYGQRRLNNLVIEDLERDVTALAQHASQRHQQRLSRTDDLLRVLSQLPEVRQAGARCGDILGAMVKGMSSYENLGIVDAQGRLLCSALPTDEEVSAARRPWFQRAMATGDVAIGDFQVGQLTRKPTVNVALPIRADDGSIEFVIFAAIGLRDVSQMLDEVTPDGSSLTLVDGNGTVMVRIPEEESWLGRTITDTELFAALRRAASGSAMLQGIDGRRRMYAWNSIRQGGRGTATLAVGVPVGDLMSSRAQVMARTLLGLGVLCLLLIALVWTTSTYRIVWRIRRLTAYSRELQEGRLSTRTPESRSEDELGQLAVAMNDLARGTEAALRTRDDTLALLDTLLRTAPVGLAFFDTDLRFARVNEQLARINAVPVEAHLGRKFPEVLPHLADEVVPCLERVLESGEPVLDLHVDDPRTLRNFIAGFYPVKDVSQAAVGIGVVVVDVTEQRRSAEHQRQVAQAAEALAQSLELESSVQVFAEQLSSTAGVCCHIRIQTPEEGEVVEVTRGPFPADQQVESFELISHSRVLGEVKLCPDPAAPLGTHDRALLQEVLSRGAAAIDKAWLYRQAQAAIRQREDFLSVAAHELKSPLTSLLLNVDLAAREIEKTAPSPGLVGRIARLGDGLHRLDRLVDSLLDVSRLRAGRFELTRTEGDLAEVVRSLADRFSDIARAAGSQVALEVPAQVRGEFDVQRVEIALGNLVSNAIKYGGGSPVRIRLWVQGQDAFIAVKDGGPGIPLEDQPRIFERFERAKSAGNVRGFGFGLYLTKQIVVAHGGRVSVASAEGQGSEFTAQLPLQAPQEPSDGQKEPPRA